MKTCKCGATFPNWMTIDGKLHNLGSRVRCLDCQPFKSPRPTCSVENFRARKRNNTRNWRDKFVEAHGADPANLIRSRNRRAILCLIGYRCQKCGYDKTITNIVFHHLKDKSFELGNKAFGHQFKKIIAELRKCVAYCHNCHGEYHRGLIDDKIVIDHNCQLNKAIDTICNCGDWLVVLDKLKLPRDYTLPMRP